MMWVFSKSNYYYLEEKNEKYALKSVQFLMPRFMEAQLSVVLAIKN